MANEEQYLGDETGPPDYTSFYENFEAEIGPQKEEEEEGIPFDAYVQELSSVVDSEDFWELPYEDKVGKVRQVYLGEDLQGNKNYRENDQVVDLHRQTLADIRAFDGVKFDLSEIAEEVPRPPPELIDAVRNKNDEEIDKQLDSWEATALSTLRSKGLKWKEIEDQAEPMLADFVDTAKNELKARREYGDDPNRLEWLASNFSQVFRSGMETFASLVPGETGERLKRKAKTATEIPGTLFTPRIPLAPQASTIEPPPKLEIAEGVEISSEGLAEGLGSGAAFVGLGAVGGGLAGAPGVFAAMVPAAARAGYAETYDEIYRKTGDAREATYGAVKGALVESADALFDATVLGGYVKPLYKGITKAAKLDALSELIFRGKLGKGLQTGFKEITKAAPIVGAEAGTEVAQEYLQGQIVARATGDPTDAATPGELVTAGIAGGILGVVGAGANVTESQPVSTEVLSRGEEEKNVVLSEAGVAPSQVAAPSLTAEPQAERSDVLPKRELSGKGREEALQQQEAQQPLTQQPVTQQPVTQEPVTQEPVTQEPVTQEPVTQEPVTQEPVTQEPVTQEPVTQQPVTQQPIEERPIPFSAPEPVANEQATVSEPIDIDEIEDISVPDSLTGKPISAKEAIRTKNPNEINELLASPEIQESELKAPLESALRDYKIELIKKDKSYFNRQANKLAKAEAKNDPVAAANSNREIRGLYIKAGGRSMMEEFDAATVEEKKKLYSKLLEKKRQELQPFGISAAAGQSFGVSEVFTKAEAAREAAIARGAPEEAPFGETTRAELVSQNAGEYLKTSFSEQEFFADRFLADKDKLSLAREIADPNLPNPLAGLSETTASVATAKILNEVDARQLEAESRGDTEAANELAQLGVDTYINYQTRRTGIAQEMAVGRLNNQILGITNQDQVISLVEDVVSAGRQLTPELQKEMLGLSQEADRVAVDENIAGETASRIEATQTAIDDLRVKISEKTNRLNTAKENLQSKKSELEKEKRNLQGKDRRLDKKAERVVERLTQEIAELEKEIASLEDSLAKSQDKFNKMSEALKGDIRDLSAIRRQLEKRRKDLKKKELTLRQKRAKTRERLTLRTLPKKYQGQIKNLADKFVAAPKGSFLRQEIAGEMIGLAVEASGGFSPLEVGNAIWYTNALSGLSTQGINIWGNGVALFMRSLGFLIRNPSLAIPYFQGLAEGSKKGRTDAKSIIKEGRVGRGSLEGKLTPGNIKPFIEYLQQDSALETLFQSPGSLPDKVKKIISDSKGRPITDTLTAFGLGKFMNRLLRAGDAFFYRTAHDAMAAAVVAKEAKKAGKTDEQIAEAVSESLFMSSKRAKDAIAEAEKFVKDAFGEGNYSPTDVNRVAIEIMDQSLPESVRNEADRWGSLATYTQEPSGMFGRVASLAKTFLNLTTIPTRWGDLRLGQPIIPFVDIAANVAETGLEFSPLGLIKAEFQQEQSQKIEMRTNAIIGSVMATIIYGLADKFSDDDDPPIAIYGSMKPLSYERQQQEMAKGVRRNTLKIGNMYIPFAETPLYWLGAIGAHFDNKRWNKKYDETVGEKYLTSMISGIAGAFGDQGTLKGLSSALGLFGKDGTGNITGDLGRYFGVYLPGGALARDLDRIFNARFQETAPSSPEGAANVGQNFLGSVFKNYPVIGDVVNKPMLNGFGEELKPEIEERFGLIRRSIGTWRKGDLDPEWEFLADRGLNFSGFTRKITIESLGRSKGAKLQQMATAAQREKNLGRIWSETLTPEERYAYIKLTGPLIKREIRNVMNSAGSKSREVLQAEIDKAVTKAKTEGKARLASRMSNWSSYQSYIEGELAP